MPAPTVLVELQLNGVWVDITTYVRVDAGIGITYGIRSESGTADPSTCNLTLNNRDGRFSPRNTAGPYYGHLSRNTPVRVSVDGQIRFAGEIAEFPARWNLPGSDVWTPVVASGVLRRLLRDNLLRSTLTSGILKLAAGGHITGYWPMEDALGSTTFASEVAGAGAGYVTAGAPVLAAVDPGVASYPIPTWSAASGIVVPKRSTGTGFTAGFYLSIPAGGTTDEAELFRVVTAGTARSWIFQYDATTGGIRIRVGNSGGTEIHNTVYSFGTVPGVPMYFKLEAVQNGANVDWYIDSYDGPGWPGTLVGYTTGAPEYAVIGADAQLTGEVGIGHVVLGDTNTALFSTTFDLALRGYAGETITARMTRLAALAGVPISITSVGTEGAELGIQEDGTPLEAMRAAEAADGGILRDSTTVANGLVYITRKARYNVTQTGLQLDYSLGHLSPPLEPTDDDANVRNDVTVTRIGGSSARAVDLTGPLNAQEYPTGIGPYPYGAQLSLYRDSQLPDVAGWLLNLGTVDETRWPAVTVDLVKWPVLAATLVNIRPGGRLTLLNLPAWVGTGYAELQVIGWTEAIGPSTRTITFNCVPHTPWHVFRLDDPTYGVLDSDNRLAL